MSRNELIPFTQRQRAFIYCALQSYIHVSKNIHPYIGMKHKCQETVIWEEGSHAFKCDKKVLKNKLSEIKNNYNIQIIYLLFQ